MCSECFSLVCAQHATPFKELFISDTNPSRREKDVLAGSHMVLAAVTVSALKVELS